MAASRLSRLAKTLVALLGAGAACCGKTIATQSDCVSPAACEPPDGGPLVGPDGAVQDAAVGLFGADGGRDAATADSGADGTTGPTDGGADGTTPEDAGPDAGAPVAPSCLDWQTTFGATADGVYVIDPYPGFPSFSVYCYGMSTTAPQEYLPLTRTSLLASPQYNYSLYAGGGACSCPDYYVVFSKVRLELSTLSVVIKDRTFAQATDGTCATSGGVNCGHALVLPWAMAGGCVAENDASGTADVDLTGTPFEIRGGTVFQSVGFDATGTLSMTADWKVADLTGGGYCGWYGSVPPLADNSDFPPDTARLPLAFDDGGVPPLGDEDAGDAGD